MDIKPIAPRMGLRPMDSEFKRVMAPPLALLTLAGLTPPGHDCRIEDENTGRLNLEDRPDLVGITANVNTAHRAYEIAGHYRRRGSKVILGGIHASANPDEALEHADSVCVGEAEIRGEIGQQAVIRDGVNLLIQSSPLSTAGSVPSQRHTSV